MTDDVANAKVHTLNWGGTGVGKTRFIGTAPSPFVIAPENGLLTLHDLGIPYVSITDDMVIYDTVMAILDSAEAREVVEIDDEGNVVDFSKIETLALDSLWRLSELLMAELNDQGVSGFDMWGQLSTKLNRIVTRMQSLGYHTITTCGEAVKTDRLDESLKVPVLNLSGGFRDQAPYLFDLNLYMDIETRGRNQIYRTHTKPVNKRTAKSRVELPAVITDPNFTDIIEQIKEGLKKK